jgi:hypothetical protein
LVEACVGSAGRVGQPFEPVTYANLANPQTLNLYAIVADNPATDVDADGHVLFVAASGLELTREEGLLKGLVPGIGFQTDPHTQVTVASWTPVPGWQYKCDSFCYDIINAILSDSAYVFQLDYIPNHTGGITIMLDLHRYSALVDMDLNPNGVFTVVAAHWVKTHQREIKRGSMDALMVLTIASSIMDSGAFDAALPEEEAAEAELEAEAGKAAEELKYSDRVQARSAEDPGPNHNFPSSFDKEIIQNGKKTVGSDGYTQYNLRRSIKGKGGAYEIGTQNGQIVHRFFRPD